MSFILNFNKTNISLLDCFDSDNFTLVHSKRYGAQVASVVNKILSANNVGTEVVGLLSNHSKVGPIANNIAHTRIFVLHRK